ncbi:hypothetical protein PVK06_002778 [Gossypium arboreum]|uniref:Aminotransferase-like plant mobile domain-containing protein n=1 Tax=Gossypium arboreum TaxID=29729 RepID=A0ABR0R5W6_GOSAR|nr:hypothetical protein PVK06_002778 [Gossypium arboreum]
MRLACPGAVNSICNKSAHWGKDGGQKHTFHLPCGECTITLEDVALQLDLPVDRSVITGFNIVSNKVTLCRSLLGNIPNKFKGGRILINWLKGNFDELLEDSKDRTEEVIQQYARAYIIRLIGGILMLNKSQNLAHVRWLLHLVDFNVTNPRSVVQSADVGHKGAVDSVRDGGNSRNRPNVATVRVEAMNFTITARPEGSAQCGHAEEGQY